MPKNHVGKSFLLEGDHYLLTVYFTDPNTICCGKRKTKLGSIGDRLFFVIGKDDYKNVPLKEKDIKKNPSWVEGNCANKMGKGRFFLQDCIIFTIKIHKNPLNIYFHFFCFSFASFSID